MRLHKIKLNIICLGLLLAAPAYADMTATILKADGPGPERRKQIQFEDELVEGMNRNPFDSLEHIANQNDRDSSHLYKKKAHFRVELKEHVREAGYSE